MNLHVMTGAFMTGKTTWVERMLAACTCRVHGIVTPAVFEGGEKIGIDAVLLPTGTRMRLAKRRVASDGNPRFAGWDFDEEAMRHANAHLAACPLGTDGCELLVVDELGPLELERGGGYTEALRLLDATAVPHALVVVRPGLLEVARRRWGEFAELGPTSDVGKFLDSIR